MAELKNPVKERIAAGEIAIGVGLRQARTVDIGKIMKACGYDWVFIDMEHNSMSIDEAAQIAVAAQDAGVAPFVRVPGRAHHHASRALDGGALGVVFPHVDTPEQAAELAHNCRYPPRGHRSITGGLPQLGFASLPMAETVAAIDAATMVVVMLESPEAIGNADAIAATDGVDALLIGTNDLCLEMGIPGKIDAPEVAAAFEKVIAACKTHGKAAALGGVYQPDLMKRYLAMGFNMVLAGSDLSFLMAAAKDRAAFVRGLNAA
jgi:2-keto-3-deoxy-L-rhamnonate aldolase RhmA